MKSHWQNIGDESPRTDADASTVIARKIEPHHFHWRSSFMARRIVTAAAAAAALTLCACGRADDNAYDTAAGATAGAMATPPAPIGLSVGATTGATTTTRDTLTDTTRRIP
jgi:hypothetical protein